MTKIQIVKIFLFFFSISFLVAICFSNRSDEVHVFFEPYASGPALLQMVELAKLPPHTPKLIAWHRFPKRADILDLNALNAAEVNLIAAEGYPSNAREKIIKALKVLLHRAPDTKFVLHTNWNHQDMILFPILRAIPRANIARIHLYEDGYGSFLTLQQRYLHPNNRYLPELETELRQYMEGKDLPYNQLFCVSIHKLYKTTYHFLYADKIKLQPHANHLMEWMKGADIQNVDFYAFNKDLTPAQKRIVYALAGFDYKTYQKIFQKRPLLLYASGYQLGNEKWQSMEKSIFDTLLDSDFTKNMTCLFKPHPSYGARGSANAMLKDQPRCIQLPAQLPYEVFVLAGLEPDFVAGFSSSLFFSVKPKNLLFYIERHNDIYLPILINLKHVSPERIIRFTKTQ